MWPWRKRRGVVNCGCYANKAVAEVEETIKGGKAVALENEKELQQLKNRFRDLADKSFQQNIFISKS